MARKKNKPYSISVTENFTEKKMEICISDHKQGKTVAIPIKYSHQVLKDIKKVIKRYGQS